VVTIGSDCKSAFLEGTKYAPEWTTNAPRNFVYKVDFETGQKTRLFEGSGQVAETVVAPLDDNYSKVIISRESPTMVPDSYLRDLKAGSETKLTKNSDFAPEVTQAIRKRLLVSRPGDDFKFWVNVTLPRDWRPGQKLPGIIWFYPREFSTQQEYDRTKRTENVNAFPNVAARSPEIWATQGYAVLQPDNPIVGPPGHMNDHYVDELRRNLDATIEAADSAGFLDRHRLGIGGHSYGAFSTMNAMTHTPYFKAGIAGDGMYNRTLTPYSFQTERRDFWEAQDTYVEMSPFFKAAQEASPASIEVESKEGGRNGNSTCTCVDDVASSACCDSRVSTRHCDSFMCRCVCIQEVQRKRGASEFEYRKFKKRLRHCARVMQTLAMIRATGSIDRTRCLTGKAFVAINIKVILEQECIKCEVCVFSSQHTGTCKRKACGSLTQRISCCELRLTRPQL
jgi:hypothetical protein